MKRRSRLLVALSVVYLAIGTTWMDWSKIKFILAGTDGSEAECIQLYGTSSGPDDGGHNFIIPDRNEGEEDCIARVHEAFADVRRQALVDTPLKVIGSWIAILVLAWVAICMIRWIRAGED